MDLRRTCLYNAVGTETGRGVDFTRNMNVVGLNFMLFHTQP